MVAVAEQIRGRSLPYLKAWRMHKFLSQDGLTKLAGVAKATISRAEKGDEIVTFTNIRKLAEALGITPDDLLRVNPDTSPTE